MFKGAVVTVSDKGFRGEREDKSGEIIKNMLKQIDVNVAFYRIVPDEKEMIKQTLIDFAERGIDLVVTTGGTGLAPRDVTPDATLEVIDREVPGMAEAMRIKGIENTLHAMLSRAVVGVRKRTLIINLPGSPKGARENLEAVIDAIPHGLKVLKGEVEECGKD
jgi:molybdenum cofactor synthesis domain-containing protein